MAEPERGVTRQIPGTLMRVHGVGVLITGNAGVGKTDTALALLKANQQLVADDAVVITESDAGLPRGSAPPAAFGLLYLRAIGIIHVATHFGHTAIVRIADIHLRAHIEPSGQQPCELLEDWRPVGYHHLRIPTLQFSSARPVSSLIMIAAQEWRRGRPGKTATEKLMARHTTCD
ncbi:MAG: hypothetical protein KGY57_00120 [Gammaproteobacteria bacterium]|nr:hypothetical protein [Gammaproteobacteria bacterium]